MKETVWCLYESYCGDPWDLRSIHYTETGAQRRKEKISYGDKLPDGESVYKYMILEKEIEK
jgi:hypothetical protein